MDAVSAGDRPLTLPDAGAPGARTLSLDRPAKANALDARSVEALHEGLDQAHRDGARVLILRGAGKNFCAGFDFSDVKAIAAEDITQRFVRIEQLLQRLRRGPLVSIAIVQGAAYGAGADLAAACTYRLGAATARFRFPGFRFGVALGTRHLARIVGSQAARDILLRNRVVDAEEALRLGLLTHCAENADCDRLADEIIADLASLDEDAMAGILALTGEDTGERDLADLIASLSAPDLKQRIARYRGSHG